jgi:poly(A) polymerase
VSKKCYYTRPYRLLKAQYFLSNQVIKPAGSPRIVARPEHIISRTNISESALKVLYRLKSSDFEAYLVGGGVRDLLLGREPKDFDIATDAHPEEIAGLFRNSRIIGRRFKLVHVRFGREVIEVATFRSGHEAEGTNETHAEDGMIIRDNVYGNLEEDAWRRDFTINSLYYGVKDFSVVDYTSGMDDLKAGLLRVIGDAEQRYIEDPVRMLRAVRFAAKLGFRIHADSEKPIFELSERLESVPPARLFDEILKLFMSGYGVATYELLRHYDIFRHLFPMTDACLAEEENHFPHTMILRGLENTDNRIAENKPVTPAFLFAILLWEPVHSRAKRLQAEGLSEIQSLQLAGDEVISLQALHIAVPKRFSLQSREIWTFQARLKRRNGKRAARLVEMARFRAAYDFLLLRIESGDDELKALGDWWTEFQESDEERRGNMSNEVPSAGSRKRRRRKRRRKTDEGTPD